MTNLKNRVDEIYKTFQPMGAVKSGLISRHDQSFKKKVAEQIQDLDEDSQRRLMAEFFGWGPLQKLTDQEDIFDIILQGPDKIYYENQQGLFKLDDCFLSPRSFQNFVDSVTSKAGILVNHKDPFGNGQLENFRIHIITPPATAETTITLRRHRQQALTFADLKNSGFMNRQQAACVEEILTSRKNFLIIGPTGSGKTSFLNTLINEVPSQQRLVVIEDTDEIRSHHPLVCKLLSRELCPVTLTPYYMEDLLKQALRMRPDRIIIGEVRGKEAKDLLQALATGHSGSLGTLHAESAQQALLRLEMLIQMGAPQWGLQSIRQLIQMSLDYLIVLKEDRQNKGIKEICKIGSLESFGLLLERLRHDTG